MRRRDENFPDNGFEGWGGYMQAKISKLEEQYDSGAGKEDQVSTIFSGVSIYVNGYTNPSSYELKALMAKHGGVYHTYQRNDDFIIASNLPDTKVKNMSLTRVVKPEWITDSIKLNHLLDHRDYLLYGNSRTQPKLNFNKCLKNTELFDDKLCPNHTNKILNHCELESKQKVLSNPDSKEIKDDFPKIESEQSYKVPSLPDIVNEKKSLSTMTAADPNFISEFYNNSRLHHISQLGACFKQHINDLRENSTFNFLARVDLKHAIASSNTTYNENKFEGDKTIMHIDMDCFFVSVGLRKRPDLRGKPVAVTHSKGGQTRTKRDGVNRKAEFNLYKQKQAKKLSIPAGIPEDEMLIGLETRVDNIADEDEKYGSMSEIASCSYEARAKGIGNGMFMGAALRLCPELQTIPYDFEGYKEVAYTLYNTVAKYTLDIEAVSCDEMYVDCTDLLKALGVYAHEFATALRDEIKQKTGCPCSTGFGGNRLQARLATKKAKPDGQFFLFADFVQDFMYEIELKDLPGVGRQTSQKLDSLGHQTCGSLQSLSLATLQRHLGIKTGLQLFDQCRGRDPNPLTFHTVRKSVSAEVNYGIRFENHDQCFEFLKQLSAEVHSRMTQFKVTGKCITLKMMVRAKEAPVETAKFMGHGFCDVINKSVNLTTSTNDANVIMGVVMAICKKQKIVPKEMRGIGIQVTKLESTSNKPIAGAMNKFLSAKRPDVNKITKTEDVTVDNLVPDIKLECEDKDKLPTTPKKVIILSPVKKISCDARVSKSPLVKRRGRPPKNLSLRAPPVTTKNLISKFLQGSSKEPVPIKETSVIDQISVTESESKAKEIKKAPEKPVGLLGFSWQKVRELLRAWLDCGLAPLTCDILLITTYMCEMVINKQIDKLNILLNFLRRRTDEMNDDIWTKVFDEIVEQVQNAMIAVYGKKLYVGT